MTMIDAACTTTPALASPRARDRPGGLTDELIADVMAFEAPYLIEKLCKEHIVRSPHEAAALFVEVKRYLLLCHHDRSLGWSMYSLRIDECWHQFVLYTEAYVAFSKQYFGKYLHHAPSNAPRPAIEPPPEASLEEFAARYEEVFGEALPDLWWDDRALIPGRRLVNYHGANLAVRVEGERAELRYERDEDSTVVIRLAARAAPALQFIVDTGTFFIRELPGGLDAAEQVAICTPLVRHGLLRVAP
jgi:hypothetical protein